jgi:hypothetical protein
MRDENESKSSKSSSESQRTFVPTAEEVEYCQEMARVQRLPGLIERAVEAQRYSNRLMDLFKEHLARTANISDWDKRQFAQHKGD